MSAHYALQPLENVTPLLIQPKFVESQPLHMQALNKVQRQHQCGPWQLISAVSLETLDLTTHCCALVGNCCCRCTSFSPQVGIDRKQQDEQSEFTEFALVKAESILCCLI